MPESHSGPSEPPPGISYGRDIVVVGGSEGGTQALLAFVAGLPAELPAAVFAALHTHARTESQLAEMLTRRGPLPARLAIHGERIVPGRIDVAPPDNHLLLRPGYVQVVRGPKENGFRPAVDPLDGGTAGLLSIKARGGLALVQDPDEAAVPEMPQSALQHVDPAALRREGGDPAASGGGNSSAVAERRNLERGGRGAVRRRGRRQP